MSTNIDNKAYQNAYNAVFSSTGDKSAAKQAAQRAGEMSYRAQEQKAIAQGNGYGGSLPTGTSAFDISSSDKLNGVLGGLSDIQSQSSNVSNQLQSYMDNCDKGSDEYRRLQEAKEKSDAASETAKMLQEKIQAVYDAVIEADRTAVDLVINVSMDSLKISITCVNGENGKATIVEGDKWNGIANSGIIGNERTSTDTENNLYSFDNLREDYGVAAVEESDAKADDNSNVEGLQLKGYDLTEIEQRLGYIHLGYNTKAELIDSKVYTVVSDKDTPSNKNDNTISETEYKWLIYLAAHEAGVLSASGSETQMMSVVSAFLNGYENPESGTASYDFSYRMGKECLSFAADQYSKNMGYDMQVSGGCNYDPDFSRLDSKSVEIATIAVNTVLNGNRTTDARYWCGDGSGKYNRFRRDY